MTYPAIGRSQNPQTQTRKGRLNRWRLMGFRRGMNPKCQVWVVGCTLFTFKATNQQVCKSLNIRENVYNIHICALLKLTDRPCSLPKVLHSLQCFTTHFHWAVSLVSDASLSSYLSNNRPPHLVAKRFRRDSDLLIRVPLIRRCEAC